MRVGLRRLRAAISLFSDILEVSETSAIKSELKWLTEELGPAREFEVFLKRVLEPARHQNARLLGMRRLTHDLAEQRRSSEERARNAVRSERFRHLLLTLATWLEIGDWRRPQADLLRERGDTPIAISAAEQLSRRSKKIRKRGRLLTKFDPHRRHKLRIQAKKLRYAAQFFETLFSGKKASRLRKAFLSALEEVQDRLGDLNDIRVHRRPHGPGGSPPQHRLWLPLSHRSRGLRQQNHFGSSTDDVSKRKPAVMEINERVRLSRQQVGR